MTFKKEVPESVVIVHNKYGAVATLRYKNPKFDKIISSPSPKKNAIHRAVEAHVLGREYHGKKKTNNSGAEPDFISPAVQVEATRQNPIIYIFLNKSLGMSVGKASAQAAHAAVFASSNSSESERHLWSVSPHKTIIVLEARDEEHIRNIETYLRQRNFTSNMIVDEGVNEIDPHTITALSSTILDKNDENVSLTFSSFSLYKDLIKFSVEVAR